MTLTRLGSIAVSDYYYWASTPCSQSTDKSTIGLYIQPNAIPYRPISTFNIYNENLGPKIPTTIKRTERVHYIEVVFVFSEHF